MKRAERQPYGAIHMAGGVFIKEMRVPDAGTLIPQHSHHYAHFSALVQGSVRVWCDDVLMGDYEAPYILHIKAEAKHRFLALTDDMMILCIHSIAEGEGEADLIHEEHHIVDA
jgi:quercetin dioxygenase-like cupin family protein